MGVERPSSATKVDRTMDGPNSTSGIQRIGIPRWYSGNDPEGFRPEAGGCGVGVTHTLTRAGREGPGDHRACSDVRELQCSVFWYTAL